jgi:hypothetical protein
LLFTDQSQVVNAWYGGQSVCFPVSETTAYNIGGWVYVPTQTPQPSAVFETMWYLDTTCLNPAGNYTSGGPVTTFVSFYSADAYDTWQYLHQESIVPPAGTHAVRWIVAVSRASTGPGTTQRAYFDSLFVTPAPGRF